MKLLRTAQSYFSHTFKARSRSLTICLSTLIGILLLVTLLNFHPGTWFSGWDNLHPEFNFSLNISRAFSLVWQGNQGTGTFGGHGYETTLFHALILSFFSLFFPDMYLRFFFTFLCLGIGSLGVFFLTRELLRGKQETATNIASLMAGLFYMLNFGTVQNFYIQLEAFVIHFAALPWVFLSLIWLLRKKTKGALVVFTLVSFLTSMQGFIPPLFFVFILLLGLFLGSYLLLGPDKLLSRLKWTTSIVVLTVALNAYWFGPVAYFTFTRSTTYLEAYNNLSSTGDFILKNKKYGDLKNLVILQGFIAEAIDTDKNNKVFEIFTAWKGHLAKPGVIGLGYSFFILIIAGLVATTFQLGRKIRHLIRSRYSIVLPTHDESLYIHLAFMLSFLLAFSLLATNTFPFNYVSEIMQKIPVAKQAFRVAFTKFSISVSFYYALFFGIGIYFFLVGISKFVFAKIRFLLQATIYVLLVTGILYFSLPTFAGYFLYNKTQIKIPDNYFQLFDFFKDQPQDQRIADLPQGWNWGWSIYDWGCTGSGFLWYGIGQPVMHRSFDVWGKGNEQYYWELTHAIYTEKFDLMDKTMQKYHVRWILFDPNVIPYLNEKRDYYTKNVKNHLDNSPLYKKVKTFSASNAKEITVYEFVPTNSTPYIISSMKNIGPSYSFTTLDQAYALYGNYYTNQSQPYDLYFPYRTFFSNQKIDNTDIGKLPISITDKEKTIEFVTPISQNLSGYKVALAPKDTSYIESDPHIYQRDKTLVSEITKIPGSIYDSRTDPNFKDHKAINCKDEKATNTDQFSQTITPEGNLRFISQASENCYSIILSGLSQHYSYLVRVTSKHIQGKRLQMALINEESRKVDVEYALTDKNSFETNYLLIPPKTDAGSGYTIHFNNISFGKDLSINELQLVTVDPIPYTFLTNLTLQNPRLSQDQQILTYFQAYDPAWSAYKVEKDNLLASIFPFIQGTKLSEHVLVNNWANGWKLSSLLAPNETVVFFFWPQYFEYGGLLLLASTLGGVGLFYLRNKR